MVSRDFSAIFFNPYFSQTIDFENGTKKTCIVQPASDDDLKILPEGDRYNPTVRVMSQSQLELKQTFSWKGYRYRIITNSIWSYYEYYDCLATRYDGSQATDSKGFIVT